MRGKTGKLSVEDRVLGPKSECLLVSAVLGYLKLTRIGYSNETNLIKLYPRVKQQIRPGRGPHMSS